MLKAVHHFPAGFLWGAATSSHQVEGDNTNNDWWLWEQQPDRILQGHRSRKACDWWGGRWKEDFDRAATGGQNAHRLSLEWSRIEPSPAVWDEGSLAHYREMIRGLLDRRMMPMVTLHHFTNPVWVAERGGWFNPEVVAWFERYVRKVASSLGDLVGLWITINEPNVYATQGYVLGHFPPGERDLKKSFVVTRHLVQAHAAAYHAIHEIRPGALVGIAHHYRGFVPARKASPLDRFVARLRHRLFNDLIPRTVFDGILRNPFGRERIPQARATQDFLGLNHYTVEHCAFDIGRPKELFTHGFYPEGADLSPTGFIANDPEGMWDALQWAHGFGLPIYITEHGVEDHEDRLRPRYIVSHLMKIWHAMNIHWRVQGYFHWTLVDNFEWERGWTQRFGLWELDVETQVRRKRASADLYAEICQMNALSSETVARYAPEVHEKLFPSRGSPDLGLTRAV